MTELLACSPSTYLLHTLVAIATEGLPNINFGRLIYYLLSRHHHICPGVLFSFFCSLSASSFCFEGAERPCSFTVFPGGERGGGLVYVVVCILHFASSTARGIVESSIVYTWSNR